MTETITDGPGPRHAFAPHPDPVEDVLYCIDVIFEEHDGRLWSSRTTMMTPDREGADAFADRLNETLGLDRAEWSALAARAFAPGDAPGTGFD